MTAQNDLGTQLKHLETRAEVLRLHSLEMTTRAGSGHPTSCLSAAEIMSVLYFHAMRIDPNRIDALGNDRFVMSKGHAAPILYATLKEAGCLPQADLLTLRETDSTLEGHPVPRVPGVQVGTGSLGQGLAVGMGMAHAMKLAGRDNYAYVLLGDGETAEGSVWEAINLAPHLELSNLIAIVDMNRLGQSDPTMLGWETHALFRRISAFGWHAVVSDGHSVGDLVDAIGLARDEKRPSFVIAKTVKGKGVSFLEDAEGRHGKAISKDELVTARNEIEKRIGSRRMPEPTRITVPTPAEQDVPSYHIETEYAESDELATRDAFGAALEKLGRQDARIVTLDGDVKNSTRAKFFFGSFPDRAVECYIAEQTMTGMAVGLAVEGYRPVAATFAAFLTRAHDQIRMAGYSDVDVTFAGSHTGVAIGEDGPSQMGLEDLSMMRSVYGSTVLSPCDAVSAEKLTAAAVAARGVAYIRTIRGDTPVIYANDEQFPVPGVKVLRSSDSDTTAIVATGTTVHEALRAAETLAARGVSVTVVDCYSIKPIAKKDLARIAYSVRTIVTVEDHYREGGLGEAVAAVVDTPVRVLAVDKRPHSGDAKQLLAEQGIDADGIVDAVERSEGE